MHKQTILSRRRPHFLLMLVVVCTWSNYAGVHSQQQIEIPSYKEEQIRYGEEKLPKLDHIEKLWSVDKHQQPWSLTKMLRQGYYKVRGFDQDQIEVIEMIKDFDYRADEDVGSANAKQDARTDGKLIKDKAELISYRQINGQQYQKVFQRGRWYNMDIAVQDKDLTKAQLQRSTAVKSKHNQNFEQFEGISIGYFQKLPQYFTDDPSQASEYDETNQMSLVFFDGDYADHFTVMRFYRPFSLSMRGRQGKQGYESIPATYKNQLAQVRQFNKFSGGAMQYCNFDITVEYIRQPGGSGQGNSTHTVTIRNSLTSRDGRSLGLGSHQLKHYSETCLPEGVAIRTKLVQKKDFFNFIRKRTLAFTILTGVVLIVNIALGTKHLEKFELINKLRLDNRAQQGQRLVSYPSQFSLMTNFVLTLTNFVIFMLYFQLSILGLMNSLFFFVMILHFIHSFCFQGSTTMLQIQIFALDNYSHEEDQQSYISQKRCYIYGLCFIFSLFMLNFVMNNFMLFLIFGCVWLPQIYLNVKYNQVTMPMMPYAVAQTLNIIIFPLYINMIDGNFLYLKPNIFFALFLAGWLTLQLLVLQVQQHRPRFMLSQAMREQYGEQFHRYEQTFDEDAALSDYSFISDNDALRQKQFDQMTNEERQDIAWKRYQKIVDYECIICAVVLSKDYEDQNMEYDYFLKTPCGHRFHKKCLLRWMDTKNECPICRSNLPPYRDANAL